MKFFLSQILVRRRFVEFAEFQLGGSAFVRLRWTFPFLGWRVGRFCTLESDKEALVQFLEAEALILSARLV